MPQINNYDIEDKNLVEAIKQNDSEAFEKLYYKYFDALIRFALYRTNSMDRARELVQEIFTKIWIKRDLLNSDKSVKSYLYKSLNNLIINQGKLHSSKNISFESMNKERNSAPGIDNELMIDIHEFITGLPEKIKTVYILSRVEGYKYNEIAEICGISEKAVEKRMSKVFLLLKKKFSDKYFK